METLKEYVENKEIDNMLNEGFFDTVGKILGFGTAGVLSAWLAALILKGGKKAISSIANTFRKTDSEVMKDIKKTAAVKEQEVQMVERKNKYDEELAPVYEAINKRDWQAANEAYHSLPKMQQDSIEIRKAVIEAIVKVEGPIITAEPTPGSKTFQGIRKTIDLATAKTMAEAFRKNLENIGVINKI